MADSIQIDIVTPERKLASEQATEVTIPGRNGYIGILPGHAPLISELAVGAITYKTVDGHTRHVACAWGFVEVLPEKVTILAEIAERAEEIDVERARQTKQRAEAALKTGTPDQQKRAQEELLRAETRLQVAAKIRPELANTLS
jgi:F-type H+-transporting ATPase subunit epsilon